MNSLLRSAVLVALFLCFSCGSDSDDSQPIVDTTPPEFSLSIIGFPENDSEPIVAGNEITVNVASEEPGDIANVKAFINEEQVGEDNTAPFQISIDLTGFGQNEAPMDYTLKVTATDNAQNETSIERIIRIDNEMPLINTVSLLEGSILNGVDNLITFSVIDNDDINIVTAFVNDTELSVGLNAEGFEVNLNTVELNDGPNLFRIEAADIANNIGTFQTSFISDNTGPALDIEGLVENQVVDTEIPLSPQVTDAFSSVSSVEIEFNDQLLSTQDSNVDLTFNFNPENFSVGEGTFVIRAEDGLGNSSSLELPLEIQRRFARVTIPEDRLNPAITLALVIISRMDGSLLTFREITPSDREIVLSAAEDFSMSDEFMLSFYLQDNGGAVGISTYQNITRNTPGTINLPAPVRLLGGSTVQIPTLNFFSQDRIISGSRGEFESAFAKNARASYAGTFNANESTFNFSEANLEFDPQPFDSIYAYDQNNGNYIFIPIPFDDQFVLDKLNFISDGIEQRTYTAQGTPSFNTLSTMNIFGAVTQDDIENNRFHKIFNAATSSTSDFAFNYSFNTNFLSYKHSYLFGNYFTERNGPPIPVYNIPNFTFDFSNNNNQISLNVPTNNKIVGKVECLDFDNPNYNWIITFDSQSNTAVIIPELPGNISHPVVGFQQAGTIKVESIQLVSYASLNSYQQYLEQVVRNQENILDVTNWYELISSSRTGNFNRALNEFIFQ